MNASLKDELTSLGIDDEFEERGGKYILSLTDQDDWGRIFSILDESDLHSDVEQDELDLFHSKFNFYTKDYNYVLTSNFDKDEYKLTITERGKQDE